MKKKIAATVILLAVCTVTIVAAFRTYSDIGDKLELDTGTQKTMKVIETIQEPVADSEAQSQEENVNDAPIEPEVTEEPVEINPEAPVLTLKSDKVELTVGSKFYVVPQVEDITDDKDNRSRLFRNIEVFGEYDRNTPGEYTLEYVVTDSDGNQSIPQTLLLVVTEE